MKCMWSIYKEITGKANHVYNNMQLEGSSEEVAENYNTFLLSVIPNLLKNHNMLPFTLNINCNNMSMYLKPTTPSQIFDVAKRIKNKNSYGIDEIPTSIVKMSIETCKEILSYLINNSFKYGIFPDYLKVSLIKPIFKKGDPKAMDSYRPISLLPAFSKIFELIMSERLVSFMRQNNLFCESQHGYLKGKSTQTAIFECVKTVESL